MGERPRTVLEFLGEKKNQREKNLHQIFLHHPASFSDLSLILERFEVIERRDQIRSAIKSQLRELALPQRADRSEGFVWTIHKGQTLVRL